METPAPIDWQSVIENFRNSEKGYLVAIDDVIQKVIKENPYCRIAFTLQVQDGKPLDMVITQIDTRIKLVFKV
jgi:hypothetical protein